MENQNYECGDCEAQKVYGCRCDSDGLRESCQQNEIRAMFSHFGNAKNLYRDVDVLRD
jgi:hypothetical protein